MASLHANTKYFSDAARAGSENWVAVDEVGSDGNTERMKMREVMRLVLVKVMRENRLDVLVNPRIRCPTGSWGDLASPASMAEARRGRPRPLPLCWESLKAWFPPASTRSSMSPGSS